MSQNRATLHKMCSAIMSGGWIRDTAARLFGHESQGSRLAARAAVWIARRVGPAIHATAPRHPLSQDGASGEVIPITHPTKENPDLYGRPVFGCLREGGHEGVRAAEDGKRREATRRRCGMAVSGARCVYAEGHGGAHSMGFYNPEAQ